MPKHTFPEYVFLWNNYKSLVLFLLFPNLYNIIISYRRFGSPATRALKVPCLEVRTDGMVLVCFLILSIMIISTTILILWQLSTMAHLTMTIKSKQTLGNVTHFFCFYR